jgi:4-hydroxy 2-oxovalerate aldolase
MYRPEVKVLDCTIRDGGLMNEWQFPKALVKDVFDGLAKAGVDYVELGYRADKTIFSPDDFGPWRFCDEEDLREVAYPCDTKVSVMLDVGRTNLDTILPAEDSIVGLYRVALYVQDIEEAIEHITHCKKLGYEVAANIMAMSHALESELDDALERLAACDVDMVYLVDSFGCLYPDQVQFLAEKYLSKCSGKTIGIHCHNNLQLALGNTIEAVECGINIVDASLYGIGRAAGNCPLELIVPWLKNPKYDVRPAIDLIQKYFQDLRRQLLWGYEMPYAITGLLNKHPKAAMAYMKGNMADDLSAFYDELLHVDDL